MVEFPPLPDKQYTVILADPPWAYNNWSDKMHGAARAWYQCLSLNDICSLPVRDIAADNCALFLWTTGPKMAEGAHILVMEAWGFRPVTCAFVWHKTTRSGDPYMGLGFYTRSGCEFVMLGLKGRLKRQNASVRQHFDYPRALHSQKPSWVRGAIQTLFSGDRIELFARGVPAPGWDSWGDQVGQPIVSKPGTLV